mgnify:CR=1 FL=1
MNTNQPVSLEVLEWSAKGLRCPDYHISFDKGNGQVYPVSLIQMPNGTGKTTTLNLLRAALSGSALNWGYQEVMSFQKKTNPSSHGQFQVSLRYNGTRITILMEFDFNQGKVSYFTTAGSGKKTGFKPPSPCKDFLSQDFINFLVFDGELAQQLLDPNSSNAKKAIENLYKLKYFHRMNSLISTYWKKKIESATATGKKGLTQRKHRVKVLEGRLTLLKTQKEKLENDLSTKVKQLEALQSKYQEKISSIEDIKEEYEEKNLSLKMQTKKLKN